MAKKSGSPFKRFARRVEQEFLHGPETLQVGSEECYRDLVDVASILLDGMSNKEISALIIDLYHSREPLGLEEMQSPNPAANTRELLDDLIYGALQKRLLVKPRVKQEESRRQELNRGLTRERDRTWFAQLRSRR